MYKNYDRYTDKKKQVLKNRWVAAIFLVSLLFDQIIQIYTSILPKLMRESVVVSDRYIYDTIFTDIAANLGYDMEQSFRLLNTTLKLVPKPNLAFFIDIDEAAAFGRKSDVPDIRYLAERKKYYQECGRRLDMIVLDGARPEDEIASEASCYVLSLLGRQPCAG